MNGMGRCAVTSLAFAAAAAAPAGAASQGPGPANAAGIEIWSSADSEKTSVVKLLARSLWEFDGPERFQGVDFERAWFAPQGQHARMQTRVYAEFADRLGEGWNWTARIGTNGKTVLGSGSVHSRDWSKEIFVEREVVETPRGLDHGIYYTFAGADADLLSTERDTINVMAGLQKFTGTNDRIHLRATLVHVIDAGRGISVQLRSRYFHSTAPGEFDYYSPRDFVQVIPVVQMRRFSKSGWMYLVAGGYGAQRASASNWQPARLADLRIESPASSGKLHAFAQVQYANSSLVGSAGNYSYVLGRFGFTSRF